MAIIRSPVLVLNGSGRRGKMALDSRGTIGYTPPMTSAGLRRIRKALGLTQKALAEALGVDRVSVARWERGDRGISELAARLIQRIAAEARGKPRRAGKESKRRK